MCQKKSEREWGKIGDKKSEEYLQNLQHFQYDSFYVKCHVSQTENQEQNILPKKQEEGEKYNP